MGEGDRVCGCVAQGKERHGRERGIQRRGSKQASIPLSTHHQHTAHLATTLFSVLLTLSCGHLSWNCLTAPGLFFASKQQKLPTEAMAVRDEAITTGTAQQGDVRKRTAGQAPQANGGYDGKDVKEKTKEKVCLLAYTVASCCARSGVERDALN